MKSYANLCQGSSHNAKDSSKSERSYMLFIEIQKVHFKGVFNFANIHIQSNFQTANAAKN